MRIILLLTVLLMVVPGYGQGTRNNAPGNTAQKPEVQFYPVNPEVRYERGNSQTLVDRKPLNIAVAYRHKKISLLMEYSRFEENTGNATSSLERTHQDLSLWFRHHFLETQSQTMTFSLFGGAGAGTFDEEVKTTLMGASRLDKSPARFVAGLGVGGDLEVALTKSVDFVVAVEGRTLLASEYDPNPVWSAVLRLGISISL